MSNNYFEDEKFEGLVLPGKSLVKGEYEGCSFVDCQFAGIDLGHFRFTDCEFRDCDLSMAKLNNTAFNDVVFKGCKMQGVSFENVNEFVFVVNFEHCLLNYSSFFKRVLRKARFSHCLLHEVDFAETDLQGSVFDHCDLKGAKFEQTILEKVDFRTSFGYSLDPDRNKVKKAIFSLSGLPGLLDKYGIEVKP